MLTRENAIGPFARLAVATALFLLPAAGRAQPVVPEARGRLAQGASRATEAALVSDIPCPDPFAYHDGVSWYIFGTAADHFFLQGKALVPREMRKVALHLDHSQFPSRRPHLGIHRLPAPRRVVSRLRDACISAISTR